MYNKAKQDLILLLGPSIKSEISLFNKETNKKEIVERSWFKRGNKIIVNGYRSGDQFMARGRQNEGIFPFHKIIDISNTKEITSTKYRADD